MKKLHKFIGITLSITLLLSGCSKTEDGSVTQEPSVTIEPTITEEVTQAPLETTPIVNEVVSYPEMPKDTITLSLEDNYRTFYEIFLYSYCDSNQDGIGDINGLVSKLDYLNDNDPDTDTDLGITGIWLMPVMQSDSYHKYGVKDYYSIDKDYGTLEDFKVLIEECHKRNIKLIIDLVFNHTSNQHPWFQEAITYLRSLEKGQEPDALECKYINYYNFAKDMGDKATYRKLDGTDWYYEGVFTAEMPDLNLSNEEVKQEIEAVASYWLDLGVDGFRIDAAKEFYSGASTKNVEVLSWFQSYVKSVNPNAYMVAEVWDSFGTIASYYESGIDSIFNYAFGDSTGKIATTVNTAGNGKAGYNLAVNMQKVQETFLSRNPNAIEASFISNHDNNRAANFVGCKEELVKLLGGVNLMMNGSSFIYYGEEIGMIGTGKDENKRAPMNWSATDLTGMTNGPRAMEKQAQVFEPCDVQSEDDASILNYYRRAIRLRNQNPTLLKGTVEVINGYDQDLTMVSKTYLDSSILLIMNISDQEKQITLNSELDSYKQISGALTTTSIQPTMEGRVITLPPYAIVILEQ